MVHSCPLHTGTYSMSRTRYSDNYRSVTGTSYSSDREVAEASSSATRYSSITDVESSGKTVTVA